MAYCQHCGSDVPAGAKFCPACGREGEATAPSAAPIAPQRNWFSRHKLLTVLGGLVVVIVIAAALGGGDTDPGPDRANSTTTSDDEREGSIFPGRADAQREDQERNIGESATVDGVEGTVKAAGFQQAINDFESDGYIVADVELRNTSDETQPYNQLNWKVQTPGGTVSDSEFTTAEGGIESGDLVSGGSVAGKVVFKVGATKGDYYVIWKPNPFDAARGVWKVTI